MKTITQSVCAVIPEYMLSRIGNTDTGDDARGTLEQMRELANERAQSFIDQATPRSLEAHQDRNVFDAQGGPDLPGNLILSDDGTTCGDVHAHQAFKGLGATRDFFERVYGRRWLYGRRFPLNATVHYGTRFQNAMWNGEQVVLGDGDGRIFTSFTGAIDVIAHEMTHGVVQSTTGMGYRGEAGAVNEHLCDVCGSLVKQYFLRQNADEADWLIGAGLFGRGIQGKGLRSLAAPGTAYCNRWLGRDRQPAHLNDYVETEEDNGGVHINSGIPNHAFYRAAMAVGGPSWEVVGRIWYRTMVEGLPNQPTFLDLAVNTVDMAGELYGHGSEIQRIVADAWDDVGLIVPLDYTSNGRPARRQVLGALPRPRWRQRPARISSRPSDKHSRTR
jgi:Zn-dependent metalloprotease